MAVKPASDRAERLEAQLSALPQSPGVYLFRIDASEFVSAESETEALFLEQNLIKRHRPTFNIRLRDDKSYPYIAVTVGDRYPRVLFTRERHRKGVRYFGPYASASTCSTASSRTARAKGPNRAGEAASRAWTTTSAAASARASGTCPRRGT